MGTDGMSGAASMAFIGPEKGRGGRMAEESLYVLAGAGFTLGLFAALAHFDRARESAPATAIEDLHSVSALYEPPPPKVEEPPEQAQEIMPLTGIDIGASESPVRITVVPPDLAKII